eukprot:3115524-Alexandrium_andersonii.AAC.1
MPTGGNPNPVGTPLASAGTAATGGGGQWAAGEWARWRSGTQSNAQQTSAPAGTQPARADGPWQSSQAWGWSAYAD